MVTGFVEPGKQNPKSIRKTKATKLTLKNSPNAQELMRSITTGSSGERGWGEMKDD